MIILYTFLVRSWKKILSSHIEYEMSLQIFSFSFLPILYFIKSVMVFSLLFFAIEMLMVNCKMNKGNLNTHSFKSIWKLDFFYFVMETQQQIILRHDIQYNFIFWTYSLCIVIAEYWLIIWNFKRKWNECISYAKLLVIELKSIC